jgi:manganese/zinc/iron transport system ATP- binding protein
MPPVPVEVHDVTVAYEQKPVLWDIDLVVPAGKLVGLIGPNGAGKSTLLKAMLGLTPLTSGKVEIMGQPAERQRHLVGYVPQRETVDWDFPVSALDVVLMGTYGRLGWFRRPGTAERILARDCLKEVGMLDYADRQIRQLSGGQQQRVFIARALAQQAQILFLDEPFAGVDAATEQAIVLLLQRLREQGKTALVVHHDLHTVRQYYDHVIMLNLQLIAAGPVETTFTNENLQKTFGSRLTILDQAVEAVRRGPGER